MSSLAILLLLVMLARQGGGGGGGFLPNMPNPLAVDQARKKRAAEPAPAPLPPVAQAAKTLPAPWPQVPPSGLPPFGPGGWVPDHPPPAQVQARAWQLLSTLWKYGAGTMKTEKTAGRWITYRAEPMGKKKGVVAYRLRSDVAPEPPPEPQPSLLTS